MENKSEFERDLSYLINTKTGEHIYIDLSKENVVEVRALSRKGSMPLGVFWVHVFQHPSNYPVYSHPYKKLYQRGHEYELQLRVDEILISINLASGKLLLKGRQALDWFVRRIPLLLETYSKRPGEEGPRPIEPVFNSEEMNTLKSEKERRYKLYLNNWPQSVFDSDGPTILSTEPTDPAKEPADPEMCLAGQDLETYNPDADLFTSQETVEQLERLESGLTIPGVALYRLWRSTLNLWFSDSESRVFVVTPYIDTSRLADIFSLFLRHNLTAYLQNLIVPINSSRGKFAVARRAALERFEASEQVLLEYKVLGNVIFPVADIQNSFLATVKGGKAHVLHSNADFDASSFLTTAVTNVSFSHIEEEVFMKNFLDPIVS